MRTFLILVLAFATAAAGIPRNPEKILGGSTATIAQYPSIAALLYSNNLVTWLQHCGGIIVNTRSILTAASCPVGDEVIRWRVRVGSALSNSGGTIHSFMIYVIHSQYNVGATHNNDIAIMRTSTVITYVNNAVQPANIAGSNYYVPDNQAVSAVGWGATSADVQRVDRLNHVQTFTINQSTCASRYREVDWVVTDNMLCSGMLDVGGRGQCTGDAGGPLYHNNVVVGIYSWGMGCGLAYFPGVSTRVTHYTPWIQLYA